MAITIKLVSSKSTRTAAPQQRTRQSTQTRQPASRAGTQTRAPAPRRKKKKKSHAGLTFLLVVLALVLFAGGAFTYMGLRAQRSDTIYPNLTAYGVELGGLTVEQAAQALEQANYNGYEGQAVTVRFPADLELTVTAEEAGLCGDKQALAEKIYAYGREGNFFQNTLTYIRCTFRPHELNAEMVFRPDEAHIRARIEEAAREINSELLQNSLQIGETEITIVKGSSGMIVDTDAVYEMIYDAFARRDFATLEYTPDISEPEELNLDAIYRVVHVEPKDAEFDEWFNVLPEREGVSFDIEQAERLFDAAEYGDTITIPLVFTEPETTAESLEALLFRDVLASKTTELTWNETRSTNVELAAAATNGYILLPGEVYDFNEAVGERTSEKGYGPATAYSGGESVQEIGGGICQVSSTIYYACLYADLEIVYRTNHMYASDYVPYGMDATVSWGGPEFRFRNNTNYPIKIETYRDGQEMTATLYGTKEDDTYIEMEYEIVEWLTEWPTIYKEDPAVAPGTIEIDSEGYAGLVVETYRYKYEADGTLISKTFEDRSVYDPHPKVILCAPGERSKYVDEDGNEIVPSPSPSPEPTPEVTEEPIEPTEEPTEPPTEEPTEPPTEEPTDEPIDNPEVEPTDEPAYSEDPADWPTEDEPPVTDAPWPTE